MKVFLIALLLSVVANGHGNRTVDLESSPGEACFRPCKNAAPRVCYFKWHLEHYHVLGPACGSCGQPFGGISAARDCFNDQCITADGIERGVMSINRQIPGPSMHVCEGDTIVVDVVNMMGGTSAAIHWHGFHHRKTPFYDGVPFVTQCPIDFSTTFRYAFPATEPGTQWYHSHSGHHKVNGHYGGIVVRRNASPDPNRHTFDRDNRDHLIIVSDWMELDGEMFMPGLRSHPTGISPTNLLINGKGSVRNKTSGRSTTGTPLEVFRVQRGQRYRFRFVNSMSHSCPVSLEVEKHKLLVIASDSFDLQPVSVDSLVSTSGERYDFVINANQTGDTFWIRLRALGSCAATQVEQFAILSYRPAEETKIQLAYPKQSFPSYGAVLTGAVSLNHPNTTCGPGYESFCMTDMESFVERPDITDVEPDQRIYLGFDMYRQSSHQIFNESRYMQFMNPGGDTLLVGAINNISFKFPSFSPLTQPESVDDKHFCDENSLPESCTGRQICPCTHRLKVKLNSIVELVVVDETAAIRTVNHPFHLHGYQLFVMGMGQGPDNIPMSVALAKSMSRTRKLRRSSVRRHPIKDTISIPSKGYIVFRFKADNPGWWLLHCHFEWHMGVGMALMMQVGEPSDMVKPPENFPKCNNFTPPIRQQ